MTKEEFDDKWFKRAVKPRGLHWKIPIKRYLVTASLFHDSENDTIFAIMSEDYKFGMENPEWFTIHLNDEELKLLDEDFEIL